MAHPFDVERVRTGQDLIDFINDAVLRLQNQEIAGSVKWDGINTSFKLITNEGGEKEFRMDRGTNHTDSIVGLTADDAYAKWPEGHGMPPAIEKLLNIFNSALPLIEPELKELRMWDDPTKYFNTEYIEGKSNVQEYAANILAIHGINQFYEKKAQPHAIRKGTSMDRPGLERPIDPVTQKPVKSGGIEIPYNKEALVSLIEKVQPIAEKYGFEVYGDVPVEFDPEGDLDIEKVLDTPVAIQVVPGGVETAPLREWLKGVVHPQDKKITRADGKSIGALSKDAYMAVLKSATDEGVPLSQYLESGPKQREEVKDAINGGIFYHATRLLGQAVKNALTSKAGNVGKHEGVVLRGMEDFLVKLTGDFIVQGLASTHGDRSKQDLTEHPLRWSEGWTYTETLLEGKWAIEQGIKAAAAVAGVSTTMGGLKSQLPGLANSLKLQENASQPDVVYIPGGFKPPHRGHLNMVHQAAKRFPNASIRIVSGRAGKKLGELGRGGITLEMAQGVWNHYFKNDPVLQGRDVEMLAITEPLVALDKEGQPRIRVKDGKVITTYSPIEKISQDVYKGEETPTVAVVYSKKDEDYGNLVKTILKSLDEEGKLLTLAADVSSGAGGVNLSATAFRAAIKENDFETFKLFLPEFYNKDEQGATELFAMLGGLIEETAMSGGGIGGFSGNPFGRAPEVVGSEKEKKPHGNNFLSKNEGLVNEVMDYLLGISVG